jgi:hypothetical protein
MKKSAIATVLIAASSLCHAQSDWVLESDEYLYADYDGAELYLEDDGHWSPGDADRSSDEDGQWDVGRAAPITFSIVTESGIPTMVVKLAI